MTTLACPLCNSDFFPCEHILQKKDDEGTTYYVWYTSQYKTFVIASHLTTYKGEASTYHFEDILELDGFHILTMDRINKLLLLK